MEFNPSTPIALDAVAMTVFASWPVIVWDNNKVQTDKTTASKRFMVPPGMPKEVIPGGYFQERSKPRIARTAHPGRMIDANIPDCCQGVRNERRYASARAMFISKQAIGSWDGAWLCSESPDRYRGSSPRLPVQQFANRPSTGPTYVICHSRCR